MIRISLLSDLCLIRNTHFPPLLDGLCLSCSPFPWTPASPFPRTPSPRFLLGFLYTFPLSAMLRITIMLPPSWGLKTWFLVIRKKFWTRFQSRKQKTNWGLLTLLLLSKVQLPFTITINLYIKRSLKKKKGRTSYYHTFGFHGADWKKKEKKSVEINKILPGNDSIKTPKKKNKKLPLSCHKTKHISTSKK